MKITKDTNKYKYQNNDDKPKTYKRPLPTLSTNPCQIRTTSSSSTILEMTITDGETKNHRRQIPKMLFGLGYKVTKLHRTNFCGIKLGKLKQSGEWIHLDDGEMRLIDGVVSLYFDDDVAGTEETN